MMMIKNSLNPRGYYSIQGSSVHLMHNLILIDNPRNEDDNGNLESENENGF